MWIYYDILGCFIYLRLIGTGLSREVDKSWNKRVLVNPIHEFVLDVHGFASSRRTNKKQGFVVIKHDLHQM